MLTYEKNIVKQTLEKTVLERPDPVKERTTTTHIIKGGGLDYKKLPHEDFKHKIAKNFELRNSLETIKYVETDFKNDYDVEIEVGEYAYYIIRASKELNLSIGKPSAVPESQHTRTGKFRYRSRKTRIKIYYASETLVSFSGDFIFSTVPEPDFPIDAYVVPGQPLPTDPPYDPDNPPAPEEPPEEGQMDIFPVLAYRGGNSRNLDEYYETAVPPEFTDFLEIDYDERTGQALIYPIALAVAGGNDPQREPGEGENTIEEEEEAKEKEPSNPSDEFTDPSGNPLEEKVPPHMQLSGVLALHSDGFSVTRSGGNLWSRHTIPSYMGTCEDVVATQAGIYVLTTDKKIIYCLGPGKAWEEIKPVSVSEETEIEITNGDFETGDLTGWTDEGTNVPYVSPGEQPVQLADSQYYLTRQGRFFRPQPFTISQKVVLPDDVAGQRSTLSLKADVFTRNEDRVLLEIYSEEERISANPDLTLEIDSGNIISTNFATSPTLGELTLLGIIESGQVALGIGAAIDIGSTANGENESVSGRVSWKILDSEGKPYPGIVSLMFWDLDSPAGFEEAIRMRGDVFGYAQEVGSKVRVVQSENELFLASDLTVGQTSDKDVSSRIVVNVGAEFTTDFSATRVMGLGLTGPGLDFTEPGLLDAPIASSYTFGEFWQEAVASYTGTLPKNLVIKVSGVERLLTGGNVDVFVDNVRLTLTNIKTEYLPDLIFPGKRGSARMDTVGKEFYGSMYFGRSLANGFFEPPEEGKTWRYAAGDGIPSAGTIFSTGTDAWVGKPADFYKIFTGPVSGVIASPWMAVLSGDTLYKADTTLAVDILKFGAIGISGEVRLSPDKTMGLIVACTASGAWCGVSPIRNYSYHDGNPIEGAHPYVPTKIFQLPTSNRGDGDFFVLPIKTRFFAYSKNSSGFVWSDDPYQKPVYTIEIDPVTGEAIFDEGEYSWFSGGDLTAPIIKMVPYP